jgi:hypothetical protein
MLSGWRDWSVALFQALSNPGPRALVRAQNLENLCAFLTARHVFRIKQLARTAGLADEAATPPLGAVHRFAS